MTTREQEATVISAILTTAAKVKNFGGLPLPDCKEAASKVLPELTSKDFDRLIDSLERAEVVELTAGSLWLMTRGRNLAELIEAKLLVIRPPL